MAADPTTLRVLQSFPHKIGAGRIADTAWHQAEGASAAGAQVAVFPGVVHRPLPAQIEAAPSLARGRIRLPYRVLGLVRTLDLHDRIVARRLHRDPGRFEVVHVWPLAARRTLRAAKRTGATSFLERPNAHTRFAYDVVKRECDRIGVDLPRGFEHAYDARRLSIEEEEYELADYLLCASDFSAKTFRDAGFSHEKIVRHTYGYDDNRFYPPTERPRSSNGTTMLFAGFAAVRKGLHLALEAWLRSSASERGTFLIAGDIFPPYAEVMRDALSHPGVRMLGHRNDIPDLMRQADALVLPSLEEGFGIVCLEALASACVPLVSESCTELCEHDHNSLVHKVGDVETLAEHMTSVAGDRDLLERLAARGVVTAEGHTWAQAGVALVDAYREGLRRSGRREGAEPSPTFH